MWDDLMKLTIYQKLLMFTLPFVCFSILGVGYYSYLIAREEVMNQIGAKIKDQAEDAATDLNELGKRADIDVITLSELTSLGIIIITSILSFIMRPKSAGNQSRRSC